MFKFLKIYGTIFQDHLSTSDILQSSQMLLSIVIFILHWILNQHANQHMMMNKYLIFTVIFFIANSSLFAQNYERHKKIKDTVVNSKNLGFSKKISIVVPIEWQKELKNDFPLIIVFDKQNKRSNNYILHTIDYLASNEQIPSSIIVSIESEQRYRYIETQYKVSDPNGLGLENEKFLFEELIPLLEKEYKASSFRLFIGHSRYGYFSTSLFNSRTNELNAVISISPFFSQKNVDLTDSLNKLNSRTYQHKKYYRFAVGNDYPEDYKKMDSVIKNRNHNPFIDVKGYHFKEADHNATPGLLINTALYEVFEDWSAIQSKYISNNQQDLTIKASLDKEIKSKYGSKINFSLGILNGKGWYFYNEKHYQKAIQAWQILIDSYLNFSEAYLYIAKAEKQLNLNFSETGRALKKSLDNSDFYSEKEKKELLKEFQDMK